MRRFFLALAFLCAATAAQAQGCGASNPNCVVPTPPAADNSNRAADTAWVNLWVASAMPLASGKIWIGSAAGIATPQTPSGDLAVSDGGTFTLVTVNSNVGSFGSATQCAAITVNAKGLITAASQTACTPAIGGVTGLGAGIAAALGTNVGSAGAPVLFNGAGGTPSSITLTNGSGLPASTGLTGILPAANGGSGTLAQTSIFSACSTAVNFNSANTDHAITFPALPSGFTRVMPFRITIENASHTLVTATFGVFSATAAGGIAIVAAATAITVSATADATSNNAQSTTPAATVSFVGASLSPANTVQFRVGTAEGAAATADVCFDYLVRP